MLGVSSLNTLRPIALGVVSCPAHRLFIARPSLMSSSPRLDASSALEPRRRTSGSVHAWSCSSTNSPRSPTWLPLLVSIFIPIPSAVGGNAGPEVSSASRTTPAVAGSRPFPPLDRAVVASIACDVVARTGNPLSRQSTTDLANRARDELNKPISRSHGLAHPRRGCHQALAIRTLDLPPRRQLLREGRCRPGSVRGLLARGTSRSVRPDHQLGREDQHPGPRPLSCDPRAGLRSAPASRGGIRA
jgi:hypothetical protein